MSVKNKTILFVILLISIVFFFWIYVYINSGYSIELKGNLNTIVYRGEVYKEPGYIAFNRNGENVTSLVKVISSVDTSVDGTYKVVYKIGNKQVSRTVVVQYNLQNDIFIEYKGNNPLYILKDNVYNFKDAKAYDKNDGDITEQIIINSNVNFQVPGEYITEYFVTNSKKVNKSITRIIIIYDIDYNMSKTVFNNKMVVSINIDKEYFSKIKLPDGSYSEDNNINYTFVENGNYEFEIYDKNNYVKKIYLTVSEIDNILPSGKCIVNIYDNISKVIVNANDNKGIKGYIYKFGDKTSTLIPNNEFSYNDMTDEVKVTVYDTANNSINIKCDVRDLSTRYTRTYKVHYSTYNYKIYIPSILTKRNKLPLVVFLHGSEECGSNIDKIEANSFPKYIKNGADYNFVLIAPQIPSNSCSRSGFKTHVIKSIIDDVVQMYPIDTNRIIITGFSLGAIGTYSMIKSYPNFFAGAMPLAGYTIYDDSLLQTDIWAFHGTGDSMYNKDKKVMDEVVVRNKNSKFTVFNAPHNITDLVYKDPTVIEWIVSKRRN